MVNDWMRKIQARRSGVKVDEWWFWDYAETKTEVEKAQELLDKYKPQSKNPHLNNSQPWKKSWKRQ